MNRVCSLRALALALVLLLCTSLAFAQSDLGSIQGFVKDPSGAMVPGAKVTLRNNAGLERTVQTTDAGYFAVASIPAGLYAVSVEAAGFKKYESKDNKLDPSASLAIDVTLTVGAASETVEVTATAVALQTESGSVQRLVTRQQIDALELNGRNPIFMANLVPGTRGGNLAGLSFNFSQGPSNINGARTPESLITYDGAPAVRTRSNGTSLGSADVDSTQEIQILTANYASGIRTLLRRPDPHHYQDRRPAVPRRRLRLRAQHGLQRQHLDPQPHPRPGLPAIRQGRRTTSTTSSATTSAVRSTSPASSTRTRTSSSGIGARSGCAIASPTPVRRPCPRC